jgi:hypothetical protein
VTKSKGSEKKSKIAWGKALLVLFVAAWMFVLGVLVGRGSAPVHFDIMELQKELETLRRAREKRASLLSKMPSGGKAKKVRLNFMRH